MRKAIRKSGGKKSFWEVKRYLPRETREYVPKFIAMTYVMNYYYEHDIMPTVPNEDLMNTSSARVFESINLYKLSKELNIELATMKTLNPSFIRNYIPKSKDGIYNLVLPTPEMRIVAEKYHVLAELPVLKKRNEEVLVNNITRPMIEIKLIPAAQYISNDTGGKLPRVESVYAHAVALGKNREKHFDYKPEAYKIDDQKYTIAILADMVKEAKKSL